MATAPVSCCLIHDGTDPHLEQTVASVEPHVAEVLVTDSRTVPGAHDALGRICDFALVRNASMALATQPWVMWLDSDDLLTGGEHLADLCQPDRVVLLPYEYAYDQVGRVVTRQYRERLAPRDRMTWMYPVHEVWIARGPGLAFGPDERATVKHQRQYNPKPGEPGRNLRILESWMAAHPDDVRNQFYFGLELKNAGRVDEAVTWLTRYLGASGWVDERAMACFELVRIYEAKRDYKAMLAWAYQAMQTADWFEAHYAVARSYYHLQNWQRCVDFGRMALSAPETSTPLFLNRSDRDELHVYLQYALTKLAQAGKAGADREAYEACLAGLQGNPQHPLLRKNKPVYEKHLGIEPPKLEPLNLNRLKIVFVTQSIERWDPESIKQTGIGGSETMLAHMARELAKLGHEVTVYADPIKEGRYEGAEWKDWRKFADIACDVLVVSRFARFLSTEATGVHARLRLLWCHDVAAAGTPAEVSCADRVLALSAWHQERLVKIHGLDPAKVIVTRNGIDLERFRASKHARNPYRLVNSSSPDRSWPVLLDVFQRIRAQEPRAELHLYYGFENWKKVAAHDEKQMDLIRSLERRVSGQDKDVGVTFHGRVSQEFLAEEFLRSGVWAYPTWFTETSCISAMEAQAAGLHMVTSHRGALAETAREGCLLHGEWTEPGYQREFMRAVLHRFGKSPPRYTGEFGLPSLAREWEAMMRGLLDQKAARPLEPYVPTEPYRAKPLALGEIHAQGDVLLLAHAPRQRVKLNIACGPNIFPFNGWVNYDKVDFTTYFAHLRTASLEGMPEHQQAVARFVRQTCPPGSPGPVQKWTMPATLPHPDGTVDLIYVGQSIEHLNRRTQAVPFLRECHRLLRPGGVLRMTTPDVDKLLASEDLHEFAPDQPDWFTAAPPRDRLSYLLFGASGPDCTQTNYEGHFHLYSEQTMRLVLEEAGFTAMTFSPKPHPEIRDEGMSHSLCVEATK